MNYRHRFHAGNFSDVLKHMVLIALLESLLKKDRPVCFIDTHAGSGRYELGGEVAGGRVEAQGGVLKIMAAARPPELAARYLKIVRTTSEAEDGSIYPGSPLIAARLLRGTDRMMLIEQQSEAHAGLRALFARDRRAAVHRRDAYEALAALLPPVPPRGLALIDPPFEDPREFARLEHALPAAVNRWKQGVFCLWYPLKDRLAADHFERAASRLVQEALTIRMALGEVSASGPLRACGLLILRPPFGLERTLAPPLEWLLNQLTDNPARLLSIRELSAAVRTGD
jgi:23S rRNA (adenine2030-N6)-methyltransferase